MFYVAQTKKSLEQTASNLQHALTRHEFGTLGVHDLKQVMAKKGVVLDRECRIFDVCAAHRAKRVLDASLVFSAVLPSRITLYEEAGSTRLAALRPTALRALYPRAEAEAVDEIEAALMDVIDEAIAEP